MSTTVENAPALEPPIKRAIPGRRYFKVTVTFPDKDQVQHNLSSGIAQHVANGFMRVMFTQRGDGDDDILSVKIERES